MSPLSVHFFKLMKFQIHENKRMQILIGYFLFIGWLYLIGAWLGENQRINIIKKHVYRGWGGGKSNLGMQSI